MRCIKPNEKQMPAQWDAGLVLHQLRCCGVQEVTRIARAGYPTRYLHSDFAQRYSILLPSLKAGASQPFPASLTSSGPIISSTVHVL